MTTTIDRELLDRAREQAGITIQPWSWPGADWDTQEQQAVIQDNQIQNVFRTRSEAEAFADTLALDLIESGAIGSAV